MKIDTALYQLKSNPVSFLGNNLLSISGVGQSGPKIFYFCYHDSLAPGVNEGFRLQSYPTNGPMTGIDGKRHTAMRVQNVRMNQNTEDLDVSDIEPYVLDGTGADVMVTGQLSACIFCVRQEPGRLIVAHIQPGGKRQTGKTLRQTLKLMGRFNGGNRITHVFGLGDYAIRANVIGFRTAGTWQLYAQKIASGNGPIQDSVQII